MTKINFFTSIVFLLMGVNMQAQSVGVSDPRDLMMEVYAKQSRLDANGQFIPLSKIDDSPYWHDDFSRGKIITQDGKTLTLYLRYRIFNDIFEAKKDLKTTQANHMKLKRSQKYAILLGGERFVFLRHLPIKIKGVRNGYAMVLTGEMTDNAVLYKRLSQEFVPEKPATTPYGTATPATLEKHHYYFVKIDGQLYRIMPHRRKAAQNFPNHKKELKDYIDEEHLKFRGDDEQADVIKLVNYYNTL